ncbi:MAG: hypothetical protein Pars93KO_27010 [Parasphingorhabdus sp.]
MFEMFKASAAGEEIERDVEHVIGFCVRRVILEKRNRLVDVLSEICLLDQLLG